MRHKRAVHFSFLVTLLLLAPLGCSSESATNSPSTAGTGAVEDTRLIGTWTLQSKQTLENGHYVTVDNKYEFSVDGTFTNLSDTKLLNGDTDEPFYTSTTDESGTWTVEGDKTCWTTTEAKLTAFESFIDAITREMIEEELGVEMAPECCMIISADADSVSLQEIVSGASLVLKSSK